MPHVLNMTLDELGAAIECLGAKPFRARQVAEWVWRKGATDFAAMTNLPADLRERLREDWHIFTGRILARRDSPDGVVKLLLGWPDAQTVETVMIPAEDRRTACVSTQVGCAMRCVFCASGMSGLVRNLTAGEIVEQALQLQAAPGERISHVVFMGIGEPLANYDAVLTAVRAMIDPDRLGLSARHVTLSTIGFPELIARLAREDIPLNLAISLHAPTDELRQALIPASRGVRIDELVRAGKDWFQITGRELTLEYTLLADVNDSLPCANALARVARRLRCNVNLIRYNPAPELPFARPEEGRVRAFRGALRSAGVNVQVRPSRGLEADAACGQLRRRTPQGAAP